MEAEISPESKVENMPEAKDKTTSKKPVKKTSPKAKKEPVKKQQVKKQTVKKSTAPKKMSLEIAQPEITRNTILEMSKADQEKHSVIFFVGLIAAVALISAFITFGITQQFKPSLDSKTTLAARTSGGVCLTENELRNVISTEKITAYWAGPIKGATYSLNTTNSGQVFIRYVQKDQVCDSDTKDFRVIATYTLSGAYETTKLAGSQSNGVSLENQDGSVVYFNKDLPTNVYLSYPGIDYQIEIYDPNPKSAVTLATSSNQIQLIKG